MQIQAIIETAIYVDYLLATEAFYGTILGLRVMGNEPGHNVFFQVGEASVVINLEDAAAPGALDVDRLDTVKKLVGVTVKCGKCGCRPGRFVRKSDC